MTTIDNAVRNGVGTHNQSTIHGFPGTKQEMNHQQPFTFDADHPPVLVGFDVVTNGVPASIDFSRLNGPR